MSNVSTSNFVKITPQALVAEGSGFSLNGLLLTKNTNAPLGVPLSFKSVEAVGSYFGTTSSEYAFAEKYFAANDNKTKMPSALLVCGYNLAAQAGWLRGNTISYTLEQLQTITDGNLKFVFNGANVELTSLDFSGATSFSQVAVAIQTALRAAGSTTNFTNASVEFSSQTKAFIITSGASDETGSIGYAIPTTTAGTDLSSVLGLGELDGALISPLQASATTLSAFMSGILNQTQGFFSFTKNWEISTAADDLAENLGFATWCGLQGVRYAFFEHDMASADINPNSSADFASTLTAQNIAGTAPNYGTVLLCAFAMGTIASTNYDLTNGRITTAFKTQSGLTVTCDNNDKYLALSGKGYNCYVKDGTAGNTFYGYQRGTISGKYGFIDSYANHVWLNDQMQVAVRNLLGSTNALPYNDFGYNKVLNAIKPVIDTALNAGVINTGIDLDATQISAIAGETGWTMQDVQSVLYNFGWAFQAVSPSASVRAQRGTPILRFYYCDGGAIQYIDLISTVAR